MGAKSKAKAESDATLIRRGAPADELTANCPDLEQWPRSWLYDERDLSHGQQTRSCSRSSMTKVDRSSPTAGPKISSALSTRPAESSFASSKSVTRGANRLSGYRHVDNARALPTCPQPQQQI